MPTGKLGTSPSRLGNIVLGAGPENSLEQFVSQTLSFVDMATFGSVSTEDVDDTLTLVSTATAYVAHPVFVSDVLSFSENVHENIINISVSQTLSFTDTADGRGPFYLSVAQVLEFTETDHLSEINERVDDTLLLTDKVGRVLTASASNVLAFTDSGERKNIITQMLAFVETALVGRGGDVDQSLSFVQTAIYKAVLNRTATQTLVLNQAVAYLLVNTCTDRQYSPFVGISTDSAYAPPTVVAPTLGNSLFTLTHPYVSPSTTLVLRNPEFGNKDRLSFNRINRETRGGTLRVFADPKWPKTQVLAVQVDNLSRQQAADLLAFFNLSLGQEIGLLDWENRQWRGVITTPDSIVTHVGKNDRSVAFDFQGSLV